MRRFAICCLLTFSALPCSGAFDGPRVYWPLPKNTNIVAGHYLFGAATKSQAVADLVEAMPKTITALEWSSSYSMWTLRLDASSEPMQSH